MGGRRYIIHWGGNICIGRGCRISISRNAKLTLGTSFNITGNTTIYCTKEITFGNDCLLSWDILIMDTDSHDIIDEDGVKINYPKSIQIGNHVWIGCRNTILKGVTIGDNCIVSANSVVTNSFTEVNCIIGGHGRSLGVIKKGINWRI